MLYETQECNCSEPKLIFREKGYDVNRLAPHWECQNCHLVFNSVTKIYSSAGVEDNLIWPMVNYRTQRSD
jgi:hypothetical protein